MMNERPNDYMDLIEPVKRIDNPIYQSPFTPVANALT